MGEIAISIAATLEAEHAGSERTKRGVRFPRYFTTGKISPYDAVTWERRAASIGNDKGAVIFEQRDIEVPVDWSQTATNIVASKYFHGKLGSPERETSVAQLVQRVVDTIAGWGRKDGYFATAAGQPELPRRAGAPHADAESLLQLAGVVQRGREGSARLRLGLRPGGGRHRQAGAGRHAAAVLGLLHRIGEGLARIHPDFGQDRGDAVQVGLRHRHAICRRCAKRMRILSGGGRASGPLSFMKGFDAFAGVIKSGGKTRRAAKMVILKCDHPDIEAFIWCKAKEEKKAHTLVEAGYDSSLDGEAYSSIFFQNANNSVRVTDEFMEAVDPGQRLVDQVRDRRPAGEALQGARPDAARSPRPRINAAIPACSSIPPSTAGTPCKNTARINASNPCIGIHVPGRFRLQPVVAEPDEVRGARRAVRRGGFPPRRGHHDHGAGNHRR